MTILLSEYKDILYIEDCSSGVPYFFPSSELVWNALLVSGILDEDDLSCHHDKDSAYCQTEDSVELMVEYCKRIGIIEVEYKPLDWFEDKGDYKYGNTLK